jgi:thiol-disulfide isomerase/thioredoxin
LVLVLVAAAVLLVIQWRRPRAIEPLVGLPLPPIEAAGWINSDGPLSTDDLRGEVVLLDFWMTTCGPCIRAMPELAQIHQRFEGQGLKVIGLTPESNDSGRVREFVKHIPGLEWPVAYGAGYTFEMTGIDATPTYILYDRTGRSVWAGHWLDDAEDAVVAALAK